MYIFRVCKFFIVLVSGFVERWVVLCSKCGDSVICMFVACLIGWGREVVRVGLWDY